MECSRNVGEGLQKEYTDTNLNAFLPYVLPFAWHFLREIQYVVVEHRLFVFLPRKF